jgi:hypothetical protein
VEKGTEGMRHFPGMRDKPFGEGKSLRANVEYPNFFLTTKTL